MHNASALSYWHRYNSISHSLLQLIIKISARKAVPAENCCKFHFIFPKFCFFFQFEMYWNSVGFYFFKPCHANLTIRERAQHSGLLVSPQQLETASGLQTHRASNRCYADRISRTGNLLESDRGRLETARLCILGYVTSFVVLFFNCLGRGRGGLITINSTFSDRFHFYWTIPWLEKKK